MGEQKPLGKTPLRGNPSPESTYLPTSVLHWISNYSLIRSTSCSCSTYCFGLGFQHQNLQDFSKISKALNKVIFLVAEAIAEYISNRL